MSKEMVYHVRWGKGTVLNHSNNIYTIEFPNIGIKKFDEAALGIYIFLSEFDLKRIQNQRESCSSNESLYSAYQSNKLQFNRTEQNIKENTKDNINLDESYQEIFSDYMSNLLKIDNDFYPIDDEYISEDSSVKNFELQSISDMPIRNIVIIHNEIITIKNKKFLNIIGIDVFSGTVVKIVDTNGSMHRYHSFSNDILKLHPYTVIKAKFVNYSNDIELNVLRIKSDIKILGQSNLVKLLNKYNYLLQHYKVNFHNFIYTFDDIETIYKNNINKYFNAVVKFNNCIVKKYNKKYQLKLKNIFVDIYNPNKNIIDLNPYFTGLVLLKVKCFEKHPQITGYILCGRYFTKNEYEKIKKYTAEQEEGAFEAWYENIITQDNDILEPLELSDDDEYDEWEDYNEYTRLQEETNSYNQCDDSYFYDVKDEYYNDYKNFESEGDEKL